MGRVNTSPAIGSCHADPMWRRASRCRCRWTASSVDQGIGNPQRPPRPLRLGLEDFEEHLRVGSLVTRDAVQCAGDAQHLALQVDIVPAQSEDLALTHAEIQGRAHDRLELGTAKGVEDRSRFLGAHRGRPRRGHLERLGQGCGVASHRAPSLRVSQGRTQDRAGMVDGSRRQAAGDRLAHGDVHLLRGQLRQLDPPQERNQLVLDEAAVPPHGGRADAGLPLDPGAEKVAHRLPVGGRCHPESEPADGRVHLRDRIGAALAIEAAPDLAASRVEADRDARLPLSRASLPDRPFAKPSAPARHPFLQTSESVGVL